MDEDSDSDSEIASHVTKHFTATKNSKAITHEYIKGTLLRTAEQILNMLFDALIEAGGHDTDGSHKLAASDLEIVTICKLELTHIARQRHHGTMACRTALSAIKLLQNAELLSDECKQQPNDNNRQSCKKKENAAAASSPIKMTEPANSQFQYQNFQSRSRLDARLWLDCRYALVKSLMCEIKGMGNIKGEVTKVIQDVEDCRRYCLEGVAEAKGCGDVEMVAEFLFQEALLNFMEGCSLERTIQLLQNVEMLLSSLHILSVSAQLLRTTNNIQLIDIMASSNTENKLDLYVVEQTTLLNQLEMLGDKIEHHYPAGEQLHYSSPASPLPNIYIPHVLCLTQLKLRIGHAIVENAVSHVKRRSDDEKCVMLSSALGVLSTALNLSRVIVSRQASLEAEILLNKGKVERQLFLFGKYNHRSVVHTLLDAITISYHADHDLGLIHQAYLEISLTYLVSSGTVSREGPLFFDSGAESGDESMTPKTTKKRCRKLKSQKEETETKRKLTEITENDKERLAAWCAIRCAAFTGQAQYARLLLVGHPSVTSKFLSKEASSSIPEFVLLDMLAIYCLGEKKKIYEDDIEEEMAPFVESLEEKKTETYEDSIMKCHEEASDISWIHLLGYQSVLKRLCSTATLPVSNEVPVNTDYDSTSDNGKTSTWNRNVIRNSLFSGTWSLRLTKLHNFFTAQLPVYASDCTAMYPPKLLYLDKEDNGDEVEVVCQCYPANQTIPIDVEPNGILLKGSFPPGVAQQVYKPSDADMETASGNDISLQWYEPSLEEPNKSNHHLLSTDDSYILLLYAVGKKRDKSGAVAVSNLQCGYGWVVRGQLTRLHNRLGILAQRGEISLSDKAGQKSQATPAGQAKAIKKQARIKALSPKVKKDEHLEVLLRQCLNDVHSLFGITVPSEQDSAEEIEVPFDVNRANVKQFEKMFDSHYGSTLREPSMLTWFLSLFP